MEYGLGKILVSYLLVDGYFVAERADKLYGFACKWVEKKVKAAKLSGE